MYLHVRRVVGKTIYRQTTPMHNLSEIYKVKSSFITLGLTSDRGVRLLPFFEARKVLESSKVESDTRDTAGCASADYSGVDAFLCNAFHR